MLIRPAGAQAGAGRGRQVFSSTGDITRTDAPVSPGVRAVRGELFSGRILLHGVVSGTRTLAQGLFSALFPSDCRICGVPLVNISRLPVCLACLSAMRPISGETCDLCGERLPGLERLAEVQSCAACQETPPSFTKATAYGAYQSELRELIHLLKYEGVLSAAGVLGEMLAQSVCKLNVGLGPVLVVPIPLHASKRRQRGFNQSELIARAALRKLRLPNLELTRNVLVRDRATA